MTTSATKGKAAREAAHAAVKRWWNEPYPDGMIDPSPNLVDAVTAALEADRSQQAAIHEEELTRHIESAQDALRLVNEELREARGLLAEWVDNYTVPKGNERLDFTKRVMAFLVPGCDTFEEWKERRAYQQTGTPPADEPKYPCDCCGKLRTKAEGGTTFTVCDYCWDNCPVGSPRRHQGAPAGSGTPPAAPRGYCGRCADMMANECQPAGSGTAPADTKKREPGCRCHREEGDSACPIHDAPSGSGTAETCGRCKGSRTVPRGSLGLHALPDDMTTCPDCGGSGTTKGGTKR